MAVVIGGLVILGLIILLISVSYRKRSRKVNIKRAKVQGVPPKFHPEDDLDGMLPNSTADDFETIFDDPTSELTHPDPESIFAPASDGFSPFHNENNEWEDQEPVLAQPFTETYARPLTVSMPEFPVATINEEHEREVFEI